MSADLLQAVTERGALSMLIMVAPFVLHAVLQVRLAFARVSR